MRRSDRAFDILANLFTPISTELGCARAHDVVGRGDVRLLAPT